MSANLKATLTTKLQRKDPSLPVFVVIPAKVVAPWKLSGTTVIEGTANGYSFGRRTIKAWGKGIDAWFVEFTAPICKATGMSVGDQVTLELRIADTSVPKELESVLSSSAALSKTWSKLPDRAKRDASEYVRAAKNAATRERRAHAVVGKIRGTQGLGS